MACGIPLVGARPTLSNPSTSPDVAELHEEVLRLPPARRTGSNVLGNALLFVAILSAALVAIYVMNKGKEAEHNPFNGPPPMGMGASASASARSTETADTPVSPATASGLAGQVSLADVVKEQPNGAVLFVVVRTAGGPTRGPPLAVRRIDSPAFPVSFRIGPSDVMMQGMPFTGPFDVYARLDADGNAMTKSPTDLEAPPLRGITDGAVDLALVLGGDTASPPSSAVPDVAVPDVAAPDVAAPAARNAKTAGRVLGTVTLAPELSRSASGGTLFIILRNSAAAGPPVAVRKVDHPTFPLPFSIGPEDAMFSGTPLVGPFDITARLDQDGDAMTKTQGDILSSVGASNVRPEDTDEHPAQIVLDKRL